MNWKIVPLSVICHLIFVINCYAIASSPTVTIDGIVGSSGTIRINYTAYDADSDSVTTTGWQYSLNESNWNDISEDAIQNNSYKPVGASYITWNSSLTASVYDDSVWFRMKVTDSSGNGTINSFVTSTNTIPVPLREHSSVVYNGYLYITGGESNGGYTTAIYYVKLNSDGSFGGLSVSSSNIPTTVYQHSSVVYNGYLYVIGGANSTIYYAKLNSDGSVGGFSTASSTIPVSIDDHSSMVFNGYIYIVGGESNGSKQNKVYYAKLNSDGSVGNFNTSNNNIPVSLFLHSSVVHNGYLYITGGYASSMLNTVYYAKLNSDGSVDSFSTSSNNIPNSPLCWHSSVVYNNYLYITGGWNGSFLNTVYYAKLNSDGSVGSFNTSNKSIPTSLYNHSSAVYDNYLYVTGGYTGSIINSIYYTSFTNLVSSYTTSSSFSLENNVPPTVTVTTPSGQQSGDANVGFTIFDTASDTLSIFCEYSTDNGVTWTTATVLGNTSFANYSSYSGTITWQTDANLYNTSAIAKFRITPSDSRNSGTPAVTSTFVVNNEHSPFLTNVSVSGNTDEPSGTVRIGYTGSDPDGSMMQAVSYQYSRDNVTWHDISSSAISDNSFKFPGSSYIYWDTTAGTNNLNLIEDNSVWFKMKLTDGTFYSSTKSTGPFSIDNYLKPVVTISTISGIYGEITASTITVSYTLTAAADESLSINCEYSTNNGTNWTNATVSGSTYSITYANFTSSLNWLAGQDIPLGTDSGVIYFRITPSGRVTGDATVSNVIHIDYNAPPSVTVTDIYSVVRDTVAIQYTLADINNDVLSIVCQYSTNSGSTWKSATVVGSTYNITSANYAGSVVWYSNTDEPNISITTARFKIIPSDNETGTADETINFQVINATEPPSVTITSIEGDYGTIKINYIASDQDVGDQVKTINWQFSRDNTNWSDISETAIGNNDYKPTGTSYITWNSSLTLSGIYDDSVWFRMKVMDNSGQGGIGSFTTAINTIPTIIYSHSGVVYNGYLYIIGGYGSSSRLNTIYYAKLNSDGSVDGFSISTNTIPTSLNSHSSVVYNGYLYITGGYNGNNLNKVYYAKLNSNGIVGSFSTSNNNIPASLLAHSSVVYNGYLYITGGNNSSSVRQNTVYYAKLNDDGSVGSFSTSSNNIPVSIDSHSSVVYNGYLYITGGYGTNNLNTVFYAKLNSDGSVDSFSASSNNIPAALCSHSSVVYNDYLYITGGLNSLNKVYYAKLNSDSSVGSFSTSSNNIPNSLSHHSSVVYNGHLYITGGYFGGALNTIYYTLLANLISDYSTSSSFPIDNSPRPEVTVSNFSTEKSSNVTVSYNLSNPGGKTISLKNYYSIDSGVTWSSATFSGTISGITATSFNGTITWYSDTDLPHIDSSTVRFKIMPNDGTSDQISGETVNFHLDNNALPTAVYISSGAPVPQNTSAQVYFTTNIVIGYQLADAENDVLNARYYYSIDSGVNWSTATVTGTTNGVATNITSNNYSKYVVWYSTADLPDIDCNARFKIVPYDTDVGVSTTTTDFRVVNNVPPRILAFNLQTSATSYYRGNVFFDYQLADAANDVLSLICEYSTNTGTSFSLATVGGSTSAITSTNYISSFTWQSGADLPEGFYGNAIFRITPVDDFETGTSSTTSTFAVGNLISQPSNFKGESRWETVNGQSSPAIMWTWKDNSQMETGYRVRTATSTVDSPQSIVQSLSANTTYWIETGLTVNTAYTRYVEVYNAVSNEPSMTVTKYTLANPPTNSEIVNRQLEMVQIQWTGNGNPSGTTYKIYRSTDGNTFSLLTSTISLSYIDSGLLPLNYSYKVQAVNGDNIPTTFDVTVSTSISPNPPVNVSPVNNWAIVTNPVFSWTGFCDVDNDAQILSQLRIRTLSGIYGDGNSNDSSSVTSATNTWTPTNWNLSSGTTYYWQVRIKNNSGYGVVWSNWSDETKFMVDLSSPTGKPATPAGVVVSASSTTIKFAWATGSVDLESGIESYWLQVTTSASESVNYKYNQTVGNVLEYNISICVDRKTYYARIKTKNYAGLYSEWSDWSEGTKIWVALPTQPVSVDVSLPAGETQITNNKTIGITGTAEPGSICEIIVKDQEGRILTKDIQCTNLLVGSDSKINAQVMLGEIIKNYPLATQIQVELCLVEPSGRKSNSIASAYSVFKPENREVKLYDNVINPLNNKPVSVRYELASPSKVTVKVYNLEGELVKTIVNDEMQSAGIFTAEWWGKNDTGNVIASGIYVVHVKTDFYSKTLKVVVVK